MLLSLAAVQGCGPSAAPKAAPSAASPVSPIERFFPLQDGHVYTYESVRSQAEGPEQFMVRVRRLGPDRAELLTGAEPRTLVIADDGIRRDGSGYVLRAPLHAGAKWEGDNGGTTTLEATDGAVRVPAGSFKGCLRTVERVTGVERRQITIVFCEGVGIVTMQVEASSGSDRTVQRVELRSYGPPVDLEATE